jgi:hypothetical protein
MRPSHLLTVGYQAFAIAEPGPANVTSAPTVSAFRGRSETTNFIIPMLI